MFNVSELIVRLPPEATSRSRKAGVPEAVERCDVPPFPWIVTFAVITGRPVPPSLELLTDARVYKQPDGNANVVVPDDAAASAEIRLDV